ncbi:MAG TPA: CoA pyrophosphatase [Nevskiaceae bacterium]|nr:CoA pyrophosphatase [Nevskiaceae bacterium]
MTRLIDAVVRALHPLDEAPTQAWNREAMVELVGSGQRRPAAVLLAIRDCAEPTVVFTLRRRDLEQHGGQVSLPGGRTDPGDQSPVATALRESAEEVGLDSAVAAPLGYLDVLDTVSDYHVTPVVARLRSDAVLRAARAEVERIFEVPLAYLLDPMHLHLCDFQYLGRPRRVLEYVGVEPRIWGATAEMLYNLLWRMGRIAADSELATVRGIPQ